MIYVNRGLNSYILIYYGGAFELCINMNGTSWLDWLEMALKNVSSFKFEISKNYCLL
jgi:hypothetical protein